MVVLADTLPVVILLIVIGSFALIAIIAYVIHRILHPKMKVDPEKPSEEQVVNENLNRVLEPIEDEKLAKEVSEYKDEE